MKHVLIGDLGGTNARFALLDSTATADAAESIDIKPAVDKGPKVENSKPTDTATACQLSASDATSSIAYSNELVLKAVDHESPEAAIDHYLAEISADLPQAISPDLICIAAAGPVKAGAVSLTNNPWKVSEASLQAHFGARVKLLNDFEAIAHSLPTLVPPQIEAIGHQPLPEMSGADCTLGVVGPGTGLGASGLIRRSGHEVALTTEAGHNAFAPESALQGAVCNLLQTQFGRVSNERLVSGTGLVNIYHVLAKLRDEPSHDEFNGAAEIFAAAAGNQLAGDAVNLFFKVLGQVAGDFALAIGAWDGIYIAGGIVQRYPELMAASGFRAGFENKGRHRQLMEHIPTILIHHRHPGLLGAAAVASRL